MRDSAARMRTGLTARTAREPVADPRIRVDLAHLRALEGQAKALSFLPRQPARSVLNGRRASRMRGLSASEWAGFPVSTIIARKRSG